jgi:hypothetical protein
VTGLKERVRLELKASYVSLLIMGVLVGHTEHALLPTGNVYNSLVKPGRDLSGQCVT